MYELWFCGFQSVGCNANNTLPFPWKAKRSKLDLELIYGVKLLDVSFGMGVSKLDLELSYGVKLLDVSFGMGVSSELLDLLVSELDEVIGESILGYEHNQFEWDCPSL